MKERWSALTFCFYIFCFFRPRLLRTRAYYNPLMDKSLGDLDHLLHPPLSRRPPQSAFLVKPSLKAFENPTCQLSELR